jgi:hypothetical protein
MSAIAGETLNHTRIVRRVIEVLLASEDARLPALAARDDDKSAKSYSPQQPSLNTERQRFVKVRAAAFPVNLRPF